MLVATITLRTAGALVAATASLTGVARTRPPSFAVVSHMENLEIFKRKTDGTPWDRSENNTFGIIFGPVPKRPYSNVRPLESLNTGAGGSILDRQPEVLELVADGVGQIPVLGGAGLGAGLENLGSSLVHIVTSVGNQAGGNA